MNIDKKQLKEISQALGAASKTHAKHQGYIKAMLAQDKVSKKTQIVSKEKNKAELNQDVSTAEAYLAGGSKPMTQGNTIQSSNTNAPNMGNFGGAMNMSGVPNTPVDPMTVMPMNYGMMQDEKSATEKAAQIDAIPGMPEDVKANMKAKIDQQRIMRTVKPIKPSQTYSSYKDFRGDMKQGTIDDSTFTADSLDFTKGINPKYKLDMDKSYNYNLKNNPKAVEFVERMNQDKYKIGQVKKERKSMRVKRGK
jgi:hypothetical protein